MLLAKGYEVSLHDPQALDQARLFFNGKAHYAENPYQAVSKARAVALLTDWPEYQKLDWERMARSTGEKAVLLDAWRVYRQNPPKGFIYHAVGQGGKNQTIPKG
jgi:UDPglucose 6-dehydrogenase